MIRIPLTACDRFVEILRAALRFTGQTTGRSAIVVELGGTVAPARLESALARLGAEHPVLRARLRRPPVSGRSWWELPTEPGPVPMRRTELPSESFETGLLSAVEAALSEREDDERPPLLVEFFSSAGVPGAETSALCFTFRHDLTDGPGALGILTELVRLDPDRPSDSRRPRVLPDGPIPDPLDHLSLGARLRLLANIKHLPPPTTERPDFGGTPLSPGHSRVRLTMRSAGLAARSTLRARAAACCIPGGHRLPRFLTAATAASLLATVPRLTSEIRVPLLFPMVEARRRTVHGSLVGSMITRIPLARAVTPAEAARCIDERWDHAHEEAVEQWAVCRASAALPRALSALVLRAGLNVSGLTAGCSFVHDSFARRGPVLGLRVKRLWGAAGVPVPPALNAVVGDTASGVTLGVTWVDGYVPDRVAGEFTDRLAGFLWDPSVPTGAEGASAPGPLRA